VADVEVLTKQAHEVAMGKENGSRSIGSYQGRLFAKMRAVAGNPCVFACFTGAGFAGQSIYTAFSGAKMAGPHPGVRFFDFCSKQAMIKSFYVSSLK
jgi:hypothetical protein